MSFLKAITSNTHSITSNDNTVKTFMFQIIYNTLTLSLRFNKLINLLISYTYTGINKYVYIRMYL